MTLKGWAYWYFSRPFAGECYRVEIVAVLNNRDWQRLAGLDDWSVPIADFFTGLVAIGVAMAICKWLEPMEEPLPAHRCLGLLSWPMTPA